MSPCEFVLFHRFVKNLFRVFRTKTFQVVRSCGASLSVLGHSVCMVLGLKNSAVCCVVCGIQGIVCELRGEVGKLNINVIQIAREAIQDLSDRCDVEEEIDGRVQDGAEHAVVEVGAGGHGDGREGVGADEGQDARGPGQDQVDVEGVRYLRVARPVEHGEVRPGA